MKSYQDGEIYFIREKEYPSGNLTRYVKIGLVRYSEKRDSFGRLSEHQTGNPNRLVLEKSHVVNTQAVDLVEARLHRMFAKSRISGEWFEFEKDSDIETAVAAARQIAQEVSQLMPLFKECMELDVVPSKPKALAATDEAKEWLAKIVVARKQKKVCDDVSKEVKAIIEKAFSEGKDISLNAKNSVTNYSPRFLKEKFQEEHPKLWEKYQVTVEYWKHTFNLAVRAKDLGDEFNQAIDSARSVLDSVRETGNLGELVEVNLILKNLKGLADWEDKVAEANLKKMLGDCEEITDVCTWKRFWDPVQEFDSETFAAENPELARKYISTPEPKAQIKLKTGKA